MKRNLILLGFLVALLLSCRLSQFNPFRRVVEHSAPELTVDDTYFSEMGCFQSIDCLPEEFSNIPYPIQSIYQVSDLLGGLRPELPIAIAGNVTFYGDEEVPSVYSQNCMASFAVRYLIVVDGQMRLVDSYEGMREIYAPIENEDEALSYTIALTGYSAYYDLKSNSDYKILAKPLEETYSQFDGEVFTVHLFNDFLCGCGPHITESIDVTVTQDGEISLSEPVDAFRDVTLDNLCID